MSGIIEDQAERIGELERIVRKLCAKVGHEYEAPIWGQCPHYIDTRGPAAGADHGIKCDVCGAWKCEALEGA